MECGEPGTWVQILALQSVTLVCSDTVDKVVSLKSHGVLTLNRSQRQESLWGGGGLQSWLHAELCGLCPSVLTVFLSLSSGLGSF